MQKLAQSAKDLQGGNLEEIVSTNFLADAVQGTGL